MIWETHLWSDRESVCSQVVDKTRQHRTALNGLDNTKRWTGQHQITPDGLDNTNALELENR